MKTANPSPPLLLKVWLGVSLLLATMPAVAQTRTTTHLQGEVRLLQWEDSGYAVQPASEQLSRPLPLPLSQTAEVHALAGSAERWFLTALDGVELVVLAGSSTGVEALSSPPPSRGSLRAEPLPLADDDGLRAVAWLEGDEPYRLAVKAASWSDEGWNTVQTVAPVGPGSQLALTSVVLDHGGFVLAWAAFDGEDDEIWWSRFDGLSWTPPARVAADNRVPDITPKLRATASGAILAWSRYDGDAYRLTTAIFDGKAWTEPREIGPPGSSFPTFIEREGAPLLLSQRAVPRGWLVLELDDAGRIVRRAELEASRRDRPEILDATSEGAYVVFSGEARAHFLPWLVSER